MSNGVFGSVRPAKITPDEVEIFYIYRPSRSETDSEFKSGFQSLDPDSCLVKAESSGVTLEGMYTLKLPLDKFNKKGIYTIYIRPKEIPHIITDVSVLATYPDVKGIVLKTQTTSTNLPNDLTGYRIDFDDENSTSRLIKSCNFCEPVIVNTGDGYPKTTRYNLNVTKTQLLFCTVSPSSAPSFKPNASPYMGAPGDKIKIVNTKFSPKVIEVEMVTHDMDTLSYMLEGDQIIDKDNAIITTYNDKHEIYHQSDYYVLKNELGTPLFNVKTKRTNIDTNQDYDKIIDNE